jgi:hypothetical protein
MPVSASNPFVAMQEIVSRQIVAGLDAWRQISEAVAERTFLALYGSRTLQAAVGIDPAGTRPLRRAPKSPLHRELVRRKAAEIKSRIPVGGVREAVIRGLLYVGTTQASIDERGFELTRRLREIHGKMSLSDFKALVREQFYMLLIDQGSALEAIPSMLPSDAETREKAFHVVTQLLGARGARSAEQDKRLSQVARLFGLEDRLGAARSSPAPSSARGGTSPALKVAAMSRRGRPQRRGV